MSRNLSAWLWKGSTGKASFTRSAKGQEFNLTPASRLIYNSCKDRKVRNWRLRMHLLLLSPKCRDYCAQWFLEPDQDWQVCGIPFIHASLRPPDRMKRSAKSRLGGVHVHRARVSEWINWNQMSLLLQLNPPLASAKVDLTQQFNCSAKFCFISTVNSGVVKLDKQKAFSWLCASSLCSD